MDSSFLPWFQKGKKVTRECTPVFRFEGKGFFYKDLNRSRWLAQNKSVAFMQFHGEEQDLDDWDVGVGDYRHCKCLSTTFLSLVNIRITENTIGKALEFGFYENEVRTRKLATFGINATGLETFEDKLKCDFDQDYAWGFQTVNGTNPTFNDSNVILSCSVTCLVQMGAGDP